MISGNKTNPRIGYLWGDRVKSVLGGYLFDAMGMDSIDLTLFIPPS
jgi:hypothetical protein